MTYTLTASEEGKKVLVEVSFTDNGGSSEGPLVSALYPSTQSQTVDPNNPPTASDGTVTTVEDTDHTFAAANFSYSDTDSDPMASVKIIELPAAGTGALTLNGTAITSVDLPKTVTAAEVTGGKLKYAPPANANGTGYASFKFKVNDGAEDSASEYFMTINVTAVNDPATGAPTISGTAHVGLTLTASTAGIDDVDGLPSAFTYQWKRVDADGTSNPTDIGADSSTYTLTAAEEGKKVLVEVSFTDNGGSSEGPLVSAAYPSSGTVVNLTVSFGETTYMVTENGTISVIVHLSADPERTVAIPITATPQDSASPADYTVPPSVTFNTGQMSKTITFEAIQDEVDDDGESVLLAFGILPGGVSLGTTVTTTVSITDDDVPPVTVQFGDTTYEVVEGETVTVAVTLSADPERTVVIPITHTPQSGADSPADYSGMPESLTFNTGQMSQTITFTAAQDEVDDDGESVLLAFGILPGGVSLGTTVTTTVSITDDDVPPVTVQFGDTTYEVVEGETVTVAVTLSADPERTVVIPITHTPQSGADSPADYSGMPESLTFNTGQMSQTITFTAAQDEVDDDGESVLLGFGMTLPPAVSLGTTTQATVSITDDDAAGVTIEPAALSVVAGRSNEYTAALATEPTGEVTVTISGHAGTAVTLDKTTLTFTTDNWDTAQTVTVSATQNAATAKVTLAHTVAGADYGSVTAEPVVVSVVGVAGQQQTIQVGVSSSTQTLTVPEGGANSYTLVLGSRPTGDVAVGVTLPTGTDLTLDKTTLTFTSTNWDVAQTVTVTAAEDDDGVTDAGVTLTHTVSGGGYGSTTVPDVEVSITENDTAGLVLSKTGLTVTEGDAAGSSYTVKLATRPSGSVSVTISGHDGADLTLSGTTLTNNQLTFTTTNWATAQTVTIKAGQDDDGAADTATLTHTASGGDYAGITAELPVTVTDDDSAAIVLSETDLTVTEGYSAGSSYTVKLATEPSGSVIVTISGHDGADLTLSGTTLTNNQLTFTTTNWDTAQTVTVKAGDDDNADNESETLAHTAFGGDYVNVTKDLPVSITDDEVPVTVSFGQANYTVTEGDPVSVTVTLSADPERTVVIPLTHTPQGNTTSTDYSGVPANVTFSTGDMSQTITFTATQDDVDDGGKSVLLAFGTTLPGGVSLGTTTTTTVSITDDDGAGVSVSESSLTIAEGSSGTYTIVLDSQPTADVTVTINDPSNTDVTAEPASLTFSSTDWNTPKTVTVNAAQDADAEDETATVTHAVTSTDSSYSGAPANSVAVSVTDDEVTVTVQFGATTYEVVEGETVTVAVTLSADPERTVVIPITHTPRSGAESPADYSVPQSVTFDAGEMSKTITFTAAQDDVDDGGESVLLAFGAPLPGGVSLGTTVTTTVSITDDDDPQVAVSFDRASYRVLEGDTVTVGVTLSGDPKRTVEIPLTATDYGGASSEDYSGVPSSVTINAGETSKTFEFMAMADDASDTGESVMIGFGTSLPSRVTEGTPNEARVNINQMSTQFSLDCSITATVWCADLGFSDRVAENYGWLYMRYGHGWDPPSSLSDDDFRFRGVDYDVRSMELLAGTHPVMPNAWSTWQQGYSSFRIGIYWDHRWGAPSEEHYRDWVLHLDGLELPFKDALRHGSDFVWVGAEFQQVFNDWTPSTVTKIGIKEVAAADQDTNPLLPWAPMQVDAWPEGPDRLLIVWAKPASFYPGLPDPTSYTVQWKLASADWSDSAAVSQLEVAATSNFQAVIMNGMTEDAVYSVRVIASNDAGDGPPSEETLGRPQDSLPRLIARTVNRQTLTLRFSDQLDPNAVPAATDFVVMADGGLIMVDSVAISGDEVILTLHHAVTAATHSVLVRYDKPTDPSAVFLQDTNGNYANIRQHHELLEVVNITPQSSVQPLTAQFTNMPSSHDGRTRFTFDIEFSEPVWIGDGLARDGMLEITGGTVISAPWKDRRTDKFIVHVRPDTQDDIVIVLPGHRACHGIVGSYREVPDPVAGAPCAVGSRVLTNEPTVTIPGPSSPAQQVVENTPAEGEPQINGIPEVGQTLSADTTAISDADGLENAVFQYQWLAEDADISGATGATYTVVSGDVGQAIRVSVAFTDDGGHEETLTSAPTAVVTVAGLQLQSATVDGSTLTLTYSEVLDNSVFPPSTAFAVNVNGSPRSVTGVGFGESNVLLLLSQAVEAGDTVTVDYTAPDGTDAIQDSDGRKAVSFSGREVTNNTASSGTARSEPVQAPGSPDSLQVVWHESGKLRASWNAPESGDDPTGYTLQWKRSGDDWAEPAEVSEANAKGTSHIITGLANGVEYAVRVIAYKDDGRSAPSGEVTATPQETVPPSPFSASVDGATLTVTFDEALDTNGGPDKTAFAVTVAGNDRGVDTVSVSGSIVTITLVTAVFAGDAVTVDYTAPTDQSAARLQDLAGNAAASFSGQDVSNNTQAADRLTASASGLPTSHDDHVTFELEFSEEFLLSYKTMRDHAFTVTGGDVTNARRLDPPSNEGWEIHVEPDGDGTVTIELPVTTDCTAEGAICTGDRRPLSSRLKVTVPGTGEAQQTPANSPATGMPTISGTAQVGETLTADTSGIADADGLTNATFSYQWIHSDGGADTDISGATGSSYTLADGDVDKTVKVAVSFEDDAGHRKTLTSAATAVVVARPNSPATGAPTISGTAQVGQTLTASTSGIQDGDGRTGAVFSYQWLADGAVIAGANSSTFTLISDDEGRTIRVRVTFTDDEGHEESLTSDPTAAAAPPPNTPATGAPTISGTAQVGETLTADISGISDGDGLDHAAFAYQWLADGAEIDGATASAYTLVGDDAGKAVKVRVSFTDDAGNYEALTSAATAAVAEAEPTGPPPAPQNLTAVVNGDGQIVLSWDASSNDSITGYRILRRRPTEGEGTLLVYVADTQSADRHVHGHGRHDGSAACLPGEGDQRGGHRPRLQLRQRDPVGLERHQEVPTTPALKSSPGSNHRGGETSQKPRH